MYPGIIDFKRFLHINLAILITIIILIQSALAQQLPFRKYSRKEGLSQSQILDIVQDEKGYLWFATAECLVRSGIKSGKFVEILISDEGIGIPQEHINKIFDPYFTTKQKGSGLGLATSYSIIRRHEGHIQIKSKIGVGTEVKILLPASEKNAIEKNLQNVHIKNGAGRILVMDDEEMVRELAIQFLGHLGYDVETVADGESAVESYKKSIKEKSIFNLVIMDLTIPGGMGGKEAIQKLKEIDPEVKAVVSSGYSNDPVLANFKKFGFSAVLAKPYKIETLSTIVNKVINGKKNIRATVT